MLTPTALDNPLILTPFSPNSANILVAVLIIESLVSRFSVFSAKTHLTWSGKFLSSRMTAKQQGKSSGNLLYFAN
jgi:hypothetical protein